MIALGIVDLKTDDLEIKRERQFLIRPQFSYHLALLLDLDGITPKEAEAAPTLPDVLRTVRKTFGQSDWCAWGRDDELIRDSCARAGAEFPFPGLFHDLSAQVRLLLGLTYRPALDEALARFNLDFEGSAHDALVDARNLARLYMQIARRMR
jgi:inhibitor of KinA sporulation pathway (predicted exonuclease)